MKAVSVSTGDKRSTYEEVLVQLKGLLEGEEDFIANLSNTSSLLKMAFPDRISWVGFYLLKGGQLVLGPFQGKPACVRIDLGKGVCGTAAAERRTVIVPDVDLFPGHIACDPDSRSEIVIPMLRGRDVLGVLDVDSSQIAAFDETDAGFLEIVVQTLLQHSTPMP